MPAIRKTALLESEFEVVGNQLREIVRQMRAVEPRARRRDREAWNVDCIVRDFCSDLLEIADVDDSGGCPMCGG